MNPPVAIVRDRGGGCNGGSAGGSDEAGGARSGGSVTPVGRCIEAGAEAREGNLGCSRGRRAPDRGARDALKGVRIPVPGRDDRFCRSLPAGGRDPPAPPATPPDRGGRTHASSDARRAPASRREGRGRSAGARDGSRAMERPAPGPERGHRLSGSPTPCRAAPARALSRHGKGPRHRDRRDRAACALALARDGWNVLSAGRNAQAGHGSTSASPGVVRMNCSTRDGTALAWERQRHWADWPGICAAPGGDAAFAVSPLWLSGDHARDGRKAGAGDGAFAPPGHSV